MHSEASVIQTYHFEVDQYVRVQMSNGRSEIGVVVSIDEVGKTAVIATRHGYDITVRLSSMRRAFLLVLDLNGVLVARGKGSFVERPGVEEFIQFVMNNFVVAVWTSGLERTSIPIIDKVLDGYQDRLLFKLYRDSCNVCPTPDKPYRTIKNLQRIFDTYPKSFNAVNTIIVDDSPDKCSHPDIALCPVPFNDPTRQMDDDGLGLAMEVLQEVLRSESHAPLIRASEERLVALAAKEKDAPERSSRAGDERPSAEGAAGEGEGEGEGESPGAVRPAPAEDPKNGHAPPQEPLQETFLWKSRLCCDYILGGCARGEACRFSHDSDDGKRPCSRKNHCRHGHAARWTEDPHAPAAPVKTQSEGGGGGGAKIFDVSTIMSFFTTNPDQQRQQAARKQKNAPPPPLPPSIPPHQQQPLLQLQTQIQTQQPQKQQQAEKQQQPQQQHQRQKQRDSHSRHSKNSHQSNKPREESDDKFPRAKIFERLPEGFDIPMHDSALHREFLLQRKQYNERHPRRREAQQHSDRSKPTDDTRNVPQSRTIHITGDRSDGSALLRQLEASLRRR